MKKKKNQSFLVVNKNETKNLQTADARIIIDQK